MKKILIGLSAFGILGTSCMGGDLTMIEGKVSAVENWGSRIYYFIQDKDDPTCIIRTEADHGMQEDDKKRIYAALLTAYAKEKSVKVWVWGTKECGNKYGLWFPGVQILN